MLLPNFHSKKEIFSSKIRFSYSMCFNVVVTCFLLHFVLNLEWTKQWIECECEIRRFEGGFIQVSWIKRRRSKLANFSQSESTNLVRFPPGAWLDEIYSIFQSISQFIHFRKLKLRNFWKSRIVGKAIHIKATFLLLGLFIKEMAYSMATSC